jgi:hypothetical protein
MMLVKNDHPSINIKTMRYLHYLFILVAVLFVASCNKSQVTTDNYNQVSALFKKPTAEYTSAPLWVWNDQVTKEEIKSQLDDFHSRGIDQVFVHPRPGLVTEYLSAEWLDLFKYTVSVGKQNGMKIWIYDENSYPSGFAGGHVPAEMPESKGRMIKMSRMETLAPDFKKPIIAIFQTDNSGLRDITADSTSLRSRKGNYLVFYLVEPATNPWFAGYYYVDVMQKKVTEKFLDVTLNAYKKVAGDEFGKTVPGSFQDECNILTVYDTPLMPYTPALFDAFKAKWGYDLKDKLPEIFVDTLDYRSVRHNYYSVLLDLFINNWSVPYYDYCKANNLAFTGHYWEHEWPKPASPADNMAMAIYTSIPGIDLLMNNWGNGPGAQFGNDRAVKEVRSIANQLGKKRILSETYGAGGWELSFADQKRIVDWEAVLGINLVDQHLQYMTIAGARKRDHPQSFSYHEPWWDNYRVMADYISRLCVFGSSGEQVNSVLVIEPTTTGWMHYSSSNLSHSQKMLDSLAVSFHQFVRRLETAQVEYDLGSEYAMQEFGKVSDKALVIEKRSYKLVVLPPFTENLNSSSVKLLEEYLKQGGKILAYAIPSFVDGSASDAVKKLSMDFKDQWTNATSNETGFINDLITPGVKFTFSGEEKGIFYHQLRMLKDAQLLMLVNTSDKDWSTGTLEIPGENIEKWDAFSGEILPYDFTAGGNSVKASFHIAPKGSLILCVHGKNSGNPIVPETTGKTKVDPVEPVKVVRLSPNVLTVDYCDLKLGNKVEKDVYFYKANLKAYQYNGFVGDPWDNGVQFKSQTMDGDTLGAGTGFEADFWITLGKGVDTTNLEAVLERPSLFKVLVNDKPVEPVKGKWWLDEKFGVYKIASLVKEGKNKITIVSSPFRVLSELESVYILGNFNVSKAAKGFALVPAKPMTMGSWNEQGLPFYANKIGYSASYNNTGEGSSQFIVRLNKWNGTVAEVIVNGTKAGVFISEPYELDVTRYMKKGINNIIVNVTGSLINTLGPHHNNQPLGMAWPAMFKEGNPKGYPAGSEYRFVDYGLAESFELLSGK